MFPSVSKKPIDKMSVDNMVDKITSFPLNEKVILSAPVVRGKKGTFAKLLEDLRKDGYARVEIDGEIYPLDEDVVLDKNIKHNISIVVDRLILKEEISKRLSESIETCLKLSDGILNVKIGEEKFVFSNKFACSECGFSYEELSPRLFSFNSPFGACECCDGLGFTNEIDENIILRNSDKTVREGALKISGWNMDAGSFGDMYYRALSKRYNFSLDVPIKDLPRDILDILLYGNNGELLDLEYKSAKIRGEYTGSYEGIIKIPVQFILNRDFNV